MEGVKSEMYDVGVIGGGPAGTSAAITAAELGLRVLLLEAGVFPRHKVCGEFVSGEALELLGQLLHDAPCLPGPKIEKARVFLDGHSVELPISKPAMSLSRYELDALLWNSAISAGVETRSRTTVIDIRCSDEQFQILADGFKASARAIIDASGRWSRLRPQVVSSGENLIGLKAHFSEEARHQSCDLYFFPGGYCGVQPVGDGRVNAAAMVSAAIARNLPEVFAQNPKLADRAAKWKLGSEPVSTAPLFFAAPRTSVRGVALAGDAAAFIDPFAGDGISIALHSGRMAVLALTKYVTGECALGAALEAYNAEYRKLIQPALLNAARLRRLMQLPKAVRLSAISALKFPPLARALVHATRVRRAG